MEETQQKTTKYVSPITNKVWGEGWSLADKKDYMRDYMKRDYHDNPVEKRKYKNSISAKSNFYIDDVQWKRWGSNLSHIIMLKKLTSEIPLEVFKDFIENYEEIEFEKRAERVKRTTMGRPPVKPKVEETIKKTT